MDWHRGKVCKKRLTTSHQMYCLENLQWSELSDDYIPIKLVHFPSVIGLNNKSLLQFNFEKKYIYIVICLFTFSWIHWFFFLPLSIKQSGVWSASMSLTDCPVLFGNQRRGCLLFHFFCKHRISLEKKTYRIKRMKKILDDQGNCLLEIRRIWQDSVLQSMWSRAYICNKGFLIKSLNFVAILSFTENYKRKLQCIQQILVTSTK